MRYLAAYVLVALTASSSGYGQEAIVDHDNWSLAQAGVRPIEIPGRNSIYQSITPTLIASDTQLHNFIETLGILPEAYTRNTREIYARDREKLRVAIAKAKIDFDKEFLILLPVTFGSGSIKAWLEEPTLADGCLQFGIRHNRPGAVTMDMAYRLFAVRAPRDLADSVRAPSPRDLSKAVTLRVEEK